MAKLMYSIQQAVAEIVADKQQCIQYAKRLATSRKYRQAVNKLDRFRKNVFFKPVTWKSKRDNEFLIILGVSSKADAKSNGIFLIFVMLFNFDGCLYAATVNEHNNGPNVEIYKYHFFKRYNERFLKQPELDFKDVIAIFIRANTHKMYKKMESRKFQDSYAFIYPDGVGFGFYYVKKNYCVHNTFVTRMMLYKKQSEMTEELQEYISDISSKSWADIRDSNEFNYKEYY